MLIKGLELRYTGCFANNCRERRWRDTKNDRKDPLSPYRGKSRSPSDRKACCEHTAQSARRASGGRTSVEFSKMFSPETQSVRIHIHLKLPTSKHEGMYRKSNFTSETVSQSRYGFRYVRVSHGPFSLARLRAHGDERPNTFGGPHVVPSSHARDKVLQDEVTEGDHPVNETVRKTSTLRRSAG